MAELKPRTLEDKLYYIYGKIVCVTLFFAIPLGMTHEMNPAWGIDIGLSNGYGWVIFGMLTVFATWTIFKIPTMENIDE